MACPTGKLKVESKDPRINYNLLPGEKVMTCPYNLSHAIRPIKFGAHVFKCHRTHCKEQLAKNAEPLFAICQHDRSHHVRKEELEFHESTCKARLNDDGWGSDEEIPNPNIKVELRKPPPIDPEAMEVIGSTEDWGEDAPGPSFNSDEHVHRLRLRGYSVIKTQSIVGMTKTEKKKFYQAEEVAFKMYRKVHQLEKMKQEAVAAPRCSGRSVSTKKTGSTSLASIYGYEYEEIVDAINCDD